MLFLIFLLLSTAFLILQTTVFPLLPKWMGSPDLLFITTMFAITHLETPIGLALIAINGLYMDVFSGGYLGIYPVALLLLFAIGKLLTQQIALNDTLQQPPFTILGYLFCSGMVFFFTKILAPEQSHHWVWRDILLHACIVALLSIPFHTLFMGIVITLQKKKFKGYFRRKKKSNFFQ